MTLRWRVVGSAAVVGSLSSLLLGHTVAPLMLIGTVPPLGVRWLQTSPTYLRSSPFYIIIIFVVVSPLEVVRMAVIGSAMASCRLA